MESAEIRRMYESEERNWWYVANRRFNFGMLDPRLPRRIDLAVLDVGCGTGYNLQLLERLGEAVGVDVLPECLGYCARRGLSRLTQASALRLPFGDARFDLVACFGVLYHRLVTDDGTAVAEMHRVCKPGGLLALSTPALPCLSGEHDVAMHATRRHRRAELMAKLQGCGFEVERLSYDFLAILPAALVARRQERLRRGVRPPVSDFARIPGWAAALLDGLLRAC